MRLHDQQWGIVNACSALGQTLHVRSSWATSPMPCVGSCLFLVLSAPRRMLFRGHWSSDEFPPWSNLQCWSLQLTARCRFSPPAFAERLAQCPAAFHCCLFIPLNSLPFLARNRGRACSSRRAPSASPVRGLGRRDGGERTLPPLRGPADALLPRKYGKKPSA